jgi:sphingomyelin phosphodiesterase 2
MSSSHTNLNPGNLMELKVLSYNCWGLKYLATYRSERLSQIGAEIASLSPPPSIVALQECWTQQDFNAIRQQTDRILPHSKFYYSGIFGGGLAILSKWPIEDSRMVRYTLNGRPTAFFRGDWYVGKGVACAKIRIGDGAHIGRIVQVFCTHVCLYCNYIDFTSTNAHSAAPCPL